MKGFRKLPSQCLRLTKHQTKNSAGAHIMTTEAQTLEQALHIIEVKQIQKKRTASMKEQAKHPTLAQEFVRAKFTARGHDISLANGDVHKGQRTIQNEQLRKAREAKHVPHPYRDLPEEAKPAKAREMLASGNWGLGSPAGRRLAILFGVDNATMAGWLGIEVMSAREYDAQFARKKP